MRAVACALLVLASLFVSCPSVLADQHVRSTDGSLAVSFGAVGQYGAIGIYTNQSNVQRSFTMRFGELAEYNEAEDRVQGAMGYASNASLWTNPASVTVNGVTAKRVQMTCIIPVGASTATVNLIADVFSTAGSVTNGDQTLSVPANSVQLSLRVVQWPFVSNENNLTWVVELDLDQPSANANPSSTLFDGNQQRRLEWGGAALDITNQAVVDGKLQTIDYTLEPNEQTSTTMFKFMVGNTVAFDATASFNGADGINGAAAHSPSASMAFVALALAALLALLV